MAKAAWEKRRGSRPDLVSGGVLVGIGALGLWAGRSLPMGTTASMGPGYLPFAVSCFIVAIGVFVAAMSLTRGHERLDAVRLRPVLTVAVAIVGFAYLAENLGFVVASVWLIAVSSLADRETRPIETLISIVALTALSAAVFIVGLGVQIRLWPF